MMATMSRISPLAMAALAGCAVSCSLTTSLDDLGSGGALSSASAAASGQGASSAGTGPSGSGAVGAGPGGSGTGGASTGAGAGSATCPVQGGVMIQVPKPGGGWYCIDRTEVTASSYQAFLSVSPP